MMTIKYIVGDKEFTNERDAKLYEQKLIAQEKRKKEEEEARKREQARKEKENATALASLSNLLTAANKLVKENDLNVYFFVDRKTNSLCFRKISKDVEDDLAKIIKSLINSDF